jgi:hypothetical protein
MKFVPSCLLESVINSEPDSKIAASVVFVINFLPSSLQDSAIASKSSRAVCHPNKTSFP